MLAAGCPHESATADAALLPWRTVREFPRGSNRPARPRHARTTDGGSTPLGSRPWPPVAVSKRVRLSAEERREQIVEAGGWPTMRPLVEMAIEAMDGAQIRFFREPRVSLVEEWARWESVLFPSPVWDDYR